MKLAFGAEAYNLFNHPNFAVPSNTQTPPTLGGNGDAVFQNATGNFANNVGRIFTTVVLVVKFNWAHGSLSSALEAVSSLDTMRTGRALRIKAV